MNCKEKQKLMVEEIKEGLKKRKISQPSFAKCFLSEFYGELLNEEEVEKHLERFKKVLQLKRNSSPEIIALYYYYFKEKYLGVKTYSDESMNAAYSLYIQLDTRIATQELSEGCDNAALASLYKLFSEWRKMSEENGYKSKDFYKHSKEYMNNILRPFLSKWHIEENIDSLLFRKELNELQEETKKYIKSLENDFDL